MEVFDKLPGPDGKPDPNRQAGYTREAKRKIIMNGGDKLKNAASSGNNATGDGSFINLRNKERDKVQQGADAQFPAEFRELIKQYNVNVKNAKPAPGK